MHVVCIYLAEGFRIGKSTHIQKLPFMAHSTETPTGSGAQQQQQPFTFLRFVPAREAHPPDALPILQFRQSLDPGFTPVPPPQGGRQSQQDHGGRKPLQVLSQRPQEEHHRHPHHHHQSSMPILGLNRSVHPVPFRRGNRFSVAVCIRPALSPTSELAKIRIVSRRGRGEEEGIQNQHQNEPMLHIHQSKDTVPRVFRFDRVFQPTNKEADMVPIHEWILHVVGLTTDLDLMAGEDDNDDNNNSMMIIRDKDEVPAVDSASSMLCLYGASGSGKSVTMRSTWDAVAMHLVAGRHGKQHQKKRRHDTDDKCECEGQCRIEISAVELYLGSVIDLLDGWAGRDHDEVEGRGEDNRINACKTLEEREDRDRYNVKEKTASKKPSQPPHRPTFRPGSSPSPSAENWHGAGEAIRNTASRHTATTAAGVVAALAAAERARTTRATGANEASSRSHSLVVLRQGGFALFLVDLAGNERDSHSGGGEGVSGDRGKDKDRHRREEAVFLNQELTALRSVLTAMRRGNKHVPWRDGLLPRALRFVLDGDFTDEDDNEDDDGKPGEMKKVVVQGRRRCRRRRVAFLCTISPEDGEVQESIQTLMFAEEVGRAKAKRK